MSQPLISLCMIVKNEELVLERCLKSVSGAVDEIVIVDTGSTDQTVTIAKHYTDKIVYQAWQDDFAHARNAGLDLATGKWILFLDADEQLDPDSRNELRKWADHDEYEGLFLIFHNYSDDGLSDTINPILRMFKNNQNYRFRGRIHEQIAGSITSHTPNAKFHTTNIKIHHYGYQSEIVTAKDKLNRNMALLKLALKESPDDPFGLYNLGIEYLRTNEIQAAFESFHKARKIADTNISYSHLLYKYESYCLTLLGRLDDAIELISTGIEIYPQYTDFYHLKGVWLASLGRLDDAKALLLQAIRIGPPRLSFHSQEGFGTYQSLFELGLIHEKLHDYSSAIRCYMEANRIRPKWDTPIKRVFHVLHCTQSEKQIPMLIDQLFRISTPKAMLKVIRICIETGCYSAAQALLTKLDDQENVEEKLLMQIQCSLFSGDLTSARSLVLKQSAPNDREKHVTVEINRLQTCIELLYNLSHSEDINKFPLDAPDNLFISTISALAYQHRCGLILLESWAKQLELQEQDTPQSLRLFTRAIAVRVDHYLANIHEEWPKNGPICSSIRLSLPRMYDI